MRTVRFGFKTTQFQLDKIKCQPPVFVSVGIRGPHFNGNVCTFPVIHGVGHHYGTHVRVFQVGKKIMLHPLSPPVASFFCPKTHSSTSRVGIVPVAKFVGFWNSMIFTSWILVAWSPPRLLITGWWTSTQTISTDKSNSFTKPNSTKPLPPQLPRIQAQQIVLVESIAFAVVAVLVSTVATRFHWVVQRDSLRGIKQVFRTQIQFQQINRWYLLFLFQKTYWISY